MQHLFVPFNTALKLQEKGFNISCLATIDQTEFIHIKGTKYPIRGSMCYNEIPVPLYQQVIDWLREEKGLMVEIYSYGKERFDVIIMDCSQVGRWHNKATSNKYTSYYSALQSGIEKALQLI